MIKNYRTPRKKTDGWIEKGFHIREKGKRVGRRANDPNDLRAC